MNLYLWFQEEINGKKDNNEAEVLDAEAHSTLEEAKIVNANDTEVNDEDNDEGDRDDNDSGDDFKIEVNLSLENEAEDYKDC